MRKLTVYTMPVPRNSNLARLQLASTIFGLLSPMGSYQHFRSELLEAIFGILYIENGASESLYGTPMSQPQMR